MNDIVERLQEDILDSDVSLSEILLKAKVLAHQLKNAEFKKWVKNELDGYNVRGDIPDYRILRVPSFGVFISRFYQQTIAIPTSILPDWLQDAAENVIISDGVRTVEEFAESENGGSADWPADWLVALNASFRSNVPAHCVQVRRLLGPQLFAQILNTARSRLQDFVLEISDLPWNMGKDLPPAEQVQNLVNVTILNKPEGDKVNIFDQHGQTVGYQYNAAGNINFGAVTNQTELLAEIEKVKAEIDKAGAAKALDKGVVTDANYQLTKAIQEAEKPQPSKATLLDHIGKAKTFLEDAKAAVGLVSALMTAADIASKFF